jgi:hypothetical protein
MFKQPGFDIWGSITAMISTTVDERQPCTGKDDLPEPTSHPPDVGIGQIQHLQGNYMFSEIIFYMPRAS